MSFYNTLACYYDEIFPPDPDFTAWAVKYLSEFAPGARLIDLGCGTGNLLLSLLQAFPGKYQLLGIDASEAMLEKAQKKILAGRFRCGDFTKLKDYFPELNYAAVFCTGNTLVHLTAYDDIENFIGKASSLLADNSLLVVQIINYFKRINGDTIKSLSPVKTGNLVFERNYRFNTEKKIIFQGVITDTKNGTRFENDAVLLPVLPEQLQGLLKKYFTHNSFFGSFKMEPFDRFSSDAMVSISRKQL